MTMRCDCDHILRTTEERDSGQCARCTAKIAACIESHHWKSAGDLAYHNGLVRAPLMDSGVMREIKAGGNVLTICSAWLKGWDIANLTDGAEWTIEVKGDIFLIV